MNISPIVKQLLINGLITHSAAKGVKRGSTWAGVIVLAGGIAFVGLFFLSYASYGFLLDYFTVAGAAGIVGGALMLLSALTAGIGYMAYKGKFEKAASKNDGLLDTIESTLQSALSGFDEPIKDNPKTALLMAALAGFAAGDRLN